MPKTKLPIWDQRMIMLMDHCIESGVVDNQGSFLTSLNLQEQSLSQIKAGKSSFRPKHFLIAATKYGVDLNWLFGLSSSMKRMNGRDALQNLKDAVKAVEAEIKSSK